MMLCRRVSVARKPLLFRLLGTAIPVLVLAVPAPSAAEGPSQVSEVALSHPFFSPSLGQKMRISLVVGAPGSLTLLILDRDGFLARRLVSDQAVTKGKVAFDWDGRDDSGQIVPDEAYSLKMDLGPHQQGGIYFPANTTAEPLPPLRAVYDRITSVLSYKLPVPARVHIQAGSARVDRTGATRGPVLKTLANREPRAGGQVIETWNGWDESGTIRVSELPDFRVAIAATPLPENSIIAVGNRGRQFFDWVRTRAGRSLLTATSTDHAHHRGLASIDDVAPRLQLQPKNATWSAPGKVWLTSEKAMALGASVEGPTAKAFLRHPAKLMIFLDLKNFQTLTLPTSGAGPSIIVPMTGLAPGPHQLTVNWVSDYGPVTVNSVLFEVKTPLDTRSGSK
ncbi:MAG: hypothetical protein ACRD1P_00475 [Thermoanaerobaculia bacterium]